MSAARAKIVVADDDGALARLVAERVVAVGRDAIASRGRFTIALAGGSTPKTAYGLLAAPPWRDALDWSCVRFFFGDERCVPPDHADANYRMAREALLAPLDIAETAVFRMHGEDDPRLAADAYAAVLVEELGERPTFDLVMLGMGPDGHTASLFPGTDPMTDDASFVRAPYVQKFSTYRLTVTPRVINGARHVFVIVAGSAKAAVLHDVLEGPRRPEITPVQIVAPTAGSLTWLVDHAATADLSNVVGQSAEPTVHSN